MTILTSQSVGPLRQDSIKIVHGDIDALVASGMFNVLIVLHKNGVAFTPLIDSAYQNAHFNAGALYSTSSISVDSKYMNVVFLNVDGSNTSDFVALETTVTNLANTYKTSNIGIINDNLEYGEWEQLLPTMIHFSKVTLLNGAFEDQQISNLPHLEALNETAEQ